jgi:uncharacterized RDD family membrane protein YckC
MNDPAQTSNDVDPDAALGRRVVAGIIDLIVLLAAMIVIGLTLGTTTTGPGSFYVELGGLGTLVLAVFSFLYYFLSEVSWGRSPGKAALGLKVIGPDGGRPTSKAVALRTLLRAVDWLPFFYLVGFISALSTGKRRQRLGDLAANTRVVRGGPS